MDDYDEDLTDNEFFIQFKKRCPTIYATLPEKKWILCVPRRGSFSRAYFSDISFFSHVIVPLDGADDDNSSAALKTLRNQRLSIERKVIRCGVGFRRAKKVPILFDETFCNESGQSHVLYCIAEPLERAYCPDDDVGVEDVDLRSDEADYDLEAEEDEDDEEEEAGEAGHSLSDGHVVALNTLDDCKLLLWGHSAGPVSRRRSRNHLTLQTQMESQIEGFCRAYSQRPDQVGEFDLQGCLNDLTDIYDRCRALAASDPFLSRVSLTNPTLPDSISLATEMYLLHVVFQVVWPLLQDECAAEDASLNRQVRRLSRAFSRNIGVPREFIDRIPRARREFAQLERLTTPRGKALCLRRVIRHLAHVPDHQPSLPNPTEPDGETESGTPLRSTLRRQSVLTSDELLPILVFLIVKSNVRSWYAHLTYMRHFRMGSASDAAGEFGYYCATLEAALEHIRGLGPEAMHESEDPAGLAPVRSESNPTPRNVSAFLKLVDNGDTAAVSSLLNQSSTPDASALGVRQCHPLCRCADCERATNERSRLVGVHCYNDQGRTALHVACIRGNVDLVDLLISHGASVNVVDGQGWTGLHLACLHGHQDVVLLMLDAKADINAPDNEGNTPLHLSAERDYLGCVKALVYHGSNKSVLNIDALNMAGDSALHLAARYGYEDLCSLLLNCFASVLVRNRKAQRPPDCALTPGLRRRLLQRHESAAAGTGGGGHSPSGSSMMVESGIELAPGSSGSSATIASAATAATASGVSARTPTVSGSMVGSSAPGMSSLTGGFGSRSTSRSSGFVDGPPGVNLHGSLIGPGTDTGSVGAPPTASDAAAAVLRRVEKMLKSAGDGDLPMVRHFLGLQEDDEHEELLPNGAGRSEATLCHPLCQCDKCLPIQKRTLSNHTAEVHVNSANADGFTCLHVASIHGHLPLSQFLLRRGADPGRRTGNLRLSALHQATQYGWPELVSLLIAFGADVNAQDAAGNTPLYYAGSHGRELCAQRLLEAGAKPQVANSRGNTPLHEASRAGHVGVMRVLLSHGARPQARNKQHLTPLQFSASQEVRELLAAGGGFAARSAPASGATSPLSGSRQMARSASGSAAVKKRSSLSGPAWNSERRVGPQPPGTLSLFDNDEDEWLTTLTL